MRKLLALALCLVAVPSLADEGMWTYNAFPRDLLEKRHGVKVDPAWLDHLRLSSVRLAQGCSGSFVSPDGLVLTNHHCVETCLQDLSTAEKDLMRTGFLARTAAEEVKCPVLELNQLLAITDVTARVRKATSGLSGQKFADALKAETGRIETECQESAALRCNVVSLFHGGRYDLYRYRRHQDVRLVFAPEFAIAFFGGDPDNFQFPRYDFDMAMVRAYQDGKPVATPEHLSWNPAGPREGDVVFVSGHPGRTDRLLTMAELEYERDVQIPSIIARYSELRGALIEYGARGPEQRRVSSGMLWLVENSLKAYKGEREALVDRAFWARKAAAEAAFRRKLAADPVNGPPALAAYETLQQVEDVRRTIRDELTWVMATDGYRSDYFRVARNLVRGAAERPLPNAERLEDFQEARLPALTQSLFSTAPIDDGFETFKLAWAFARMREALGSDHPFVRKVLGKESPREVAERLVSGTRLGDPAVRRRLWEGGAAAVNASQDPLVAFARLVDPDARAVLRTYEDEVEGPRKKAGEAIARARLAVEGTSGYPDATFTLRLTFGVVRGWTEGKRTVPPFTTLAGAFERDTGREPYALPPSWLAARPRLDLTTRLDLSADVDIIGGNSGSPMVGRDGRLVGLIFDGNIWSLGGNYGFDEKLNRAVAVDAAAMVEALDKIYGARRILEEILPGRRPTATR